MQKFSACRNRDSLIHFFLSTSSPCSNAICAVGPPKLMKPNFSQKRHASENVGARCSPRPIGPTADRSWVGPTLFICDEGKRGARQSIGTRGAKFPDWQFLHAPSL